MMNARILTTRLAQITHRMHRFIFCPLVWMLMLMLIFLFSFSFSFHFFFDGVCMLMASLNLSAE